MPTPETPNVAEIVTWLFLMTNAGRILAYLPQMHKAWACSNGANSVSRMTWGYFAAAHLSGALYGFIVAHDLGMAVVFTGNFTACVTLLTIITWKRRNQRQSAPELRPLV